VSSISEVVATLEIETAVQVLRKLSANPYILIFFCCLPLSLKCGATHDARVLYHDAFVLTYRI
jgi:hypothetical protein